MLPEGDAKVATPGDDTANRSKTMTTKTTKAMKSTAKAAEKPKAASAKKPSKGRSAGNLGVDILPMSESAQATVDEVQTPAAPPETPSEEKPAKQRKAKAAVEKPKRTSALDAAAKVLAETSEPMTTKAMIETMASKGYWSSPNGQTPQATLYSAILREITVKKEASRFRKAERGLFTLNAGA